MTGELFINDKDAWLTWSARLIDNSLDNLKLPTDPKPNPQNEYRLQDGVNVHDLEYKEKSRLVVLLFEIVAESNKAYLKCFDELVAELKQSGGINLFHIPLYKTMYVFRIDSFLSLSTGIGIREGKLSVRFLEANPTYRLYYD